ncbi:MAG: NAD(P)/FAD-dependent oxidoreductase [Methanoregulaceae archaeon]
MIVILGGGPAGRFAAMHLAGAGKDVTLIEKGGIGGQCLHSGCMPVCALGDVARLLKQSRNLADLGVVAPPSEIDFPRLLAEMAKIQEKIAGILDAETRKAGVTILYGKEARLSGKTVMVGNEVLTPDAVIAATGSRPRIPEVPGADRPGIFSPKTIPKMGELPENLVIVGGGIMAAEYAHIFHAFGCHIDLVARSCFLKDLDPHVRILARKELSGVVIHENADLLGFTGGNRVSAVAIRDETGDAAIPADAVLLAAGLVPNSGMLDGVAKRRNGEVIVDDHMRTNVPGVYAAGDVTGPPNLTPVARHEGIVAAENILGKDAAADYRAIPQSMHLFNECAFVTPPEEGAAPVLIPSPAGPGSFWQVPTSGTGIAKLFVDPGTGKIEGFYSAAPGAGLVGTYLSFLMRQGVTVQEMGDIPEVHPSTDGLYWLIRYCADRMKERE